MSYADCYVLDVGQGMSNVVLFPGGEAVLVDCGPVAHVAVKLLASLTPAPVVRAIFLSHNDSDHAWGAIQIVRDRLHTLDGVFFPQDRDAKKLRWLWTLRDSLTEPEKGVLDGKLCLLAERDLPQILWPPPGKARKKDDARLTLLYPTPAQNLAAQRRNDTNASSAVLELRCGDGNVLFAGDAPGPTWDHLKARFGRIACDVFVYPHHGAPLWHKRSPARRVADVRAFLAEAIECRKLVVFSVGTHNDHEHPSEHVVETVSRAGVPVACTQITPRCCGPNPLPDSPGLMQVGHYDSLAARCGLDPSHALGVGCMGTVKIELRGGPADVPTLGAHAARVDAWERRGSKPLCRPTPGP